MAKKSQPASTPAATADTDVTFVELRAENFKRLKGVRIRPDGAVVQITGKNDMGKTSVLDAFAVAIGGKAFAPKTPIRKGEKEAEVFVDLGSLRVTRRWWFYDDEATDLRTDLIVEYADGSKAKQPQSVLNDLRGSDIAADPLEFMRLPPKDQFDVLRSLVPGVDFDAMAKQRQDKFDERTQVGRERDRAKAAADAIHVPQGTPLKLIDTTTLLTEWTAAGELNLLNARRKANWDAEAKRADDLRNEADTLMARAKKLDAEAQLIEDQMKAEPFPKEWLIPIDTAGIEATLKNSEAINTNVRLLLAQGEFRAGFKSRERDYDALSKEIDDIDERKRSAIEKAKLPVKNMSFGDDEILMNGVSFSDASKANQIRACTAITMALKPKLKVILIRDGSLLDEDSMAALAEMVEANGFVVLLERVAAAGARVGIVIDDGEVSS